MDKFLYDIWLTSCVMVNPDYVNTALEMYSDAKLVYENKEKLPSKIAEKLKVFSLNDAKDVIKQCMANNIEIIDRKSQFYPNYLLNSDAAPHILYVMGNKELLKRPLVSITGSRRANFEGKENARKFSQSLSLVGLGVVTGFADGIEEEVIRSVKEVITVLPCGILKPYPRTHSRLIKEVVNNGGVVVSPFMPKLSAYKWNFRYRNRILAAISQSTLIVQACEGSATNMTFGFCADYSRTCYAIPGPINDKYYTSTNEYLKMGASLVTSPVDIINDYGISLLEERTQTKPKEYNFNENQQKIVNVLKENDLSCDTICLKTGLDTGVVLTEILMLELEDVVVRLDDDTIKLIIKE